MSEHILPNDRPPLQADEARLTAMHRAIGNTLSTHASLETLIVQANQKHTYDLELYPDHILQALDAANIDPGSDYGFPVAAMQPVSTETFIFTDQYVRLMPTEHSAVPKVVSSHPGVSILRVIRQAQSNRLGVDLLHSVPRTQQGEVFICRDDGGEPHSLSLRMELYPELYSHYEPSIATLRFTTAKDVRFFNPAE